MKATNKQLQAIHAMLYKKGMLKNKPYIIEGATAGRSSSSRDLTFEEANALLQTLNPTQSTMNVSSRLMSKLFAMAFEMGWITEQTLVDGQGGIKKKKDYSRVHGWVEKYGYLKKPLREYIYKELPKLVSQFEVGPYKQYIDNPEKLKK